MTRVVLWLGALGLLLGVLLAASPVAPASAQGRVSVANPDGQAVVDPTYATTLTVRGTGFQSVRGGHGGVYVFFGHATGDWRPSRGGRTGEDYFYVPDSESADNRGFQQFVAFPGSDTGSSAQATMSDDGSWSVTLTVPGAVFDAFDRRGGSRSIDCRQVPCGVITVGAHGVSNASNETFTRVRVEDLYAASPAAAPSTTASPAASASPDASEATSGNGPGNGPGSGSGNGSGADEAPSAPGEPLLEVDRSAAVPGHVLPFSASGLSPGRQYSAVLDDGLAGAGPFLAGGDGRLTGVLTLPTDLGPGTHVLRLWAGDDAAAPEVGFAVALDATAAAGPEPAPDHRDPWAVALVVLGAVAVALALLRIALLVRARRRD